MIKYRAVVINCIRSNLFRDICDDEFQRFQNDYVGFKKYPRSGPADAAGHTSDQGTSNQKPNSVVALMASEQYSSTAKRERKHLLSDRITLAHVVRIVRNIGELAG